MSVEDKAKKIKLVVLDVDGVLTDGQIVTGSQGELCKHFDVKDGLGIKMLARRGDRCCRDHRPAVRHRRRAAS